MLEDKYGNTFRKDNEIGIAEDIRGGLVSALKDIEYGLDLCKANKPREAIEICRKSIENIDIRGSEVISPLGKICGHIGKILGWGHKTPNKDLGREGEGLVVHFVDDEGALNRPTCPRLGALVVEKQDGILEQEFLLLVRRERVVLVLVGDNLDVHGPQDVLGHGFALI